MEYKSNLTISKSLSYLFRRLWLNFSRSIKFKITFLILLTLFSTFLEVFSLSAVMPFLSALLAPDEIFNNSFLFPIFQYLGFTESSQIILPVSYFFLSLVFLSMIVKILILKTQLIFSAQIGNELSISAYSKIITQSYSSHKSMNTSEVISSIVNNVNIVVFHIIFFVALIISSVIFTISVFFIIFLLNPKESFIGFSLILGFYFFQGYFLRTRMKQNSEVIVNNQNNVIRSLHVVLGGIRNVILDNAHNFFINSYKKIDFKLRSAIAGNLFYGQFPRHVIEAGVLFAFIIGSLYIQSSPNYNFIDLIPILGALALAAIKLLPNIQQIYRSWSTIKGAHANFEDVINILEMNDSVIKKDISSIKKFEELEFKKVSFGYGQKTPLIFSEIDLKILKGERVGIVGATGGGKSTLIDIFMGLLDPTSGEVRINNFPIKDILNSWQGLISVVPQEIFICEGNFYENIAFGVPYEEIKLDKVIEAARNAELFSFISSQKDSFDTHIYENGSNLSGGQKQRIAIARALYKESEFIIFDEATSALDDETEKRVMESIKLLNKNNITIIMIAHRLSTLESCDIILEISNNKYQKYNSINDYKVRKKT